MDIMDKFNNVQIEELSLEALENINGGDGGGPFRPVYDLFYWVGHSIGDAIWGPEEQKKGFRGSGASGSW